MISGLCKAPPALLWKSIRFRFCIGAAVAALLEDGRVGRMLLIVGLTGVKPLEMGPIEAARRGGVERRGLELSVAM